VEIRKLIEGELPAVQRLAGVIWRRHYPGIITGGQIEYMLVRMYDVDVMRREMTEQGIEYDGLFLDGEMVGFCSHGRLGVERGAESGEREGDYKLHKLYLLPKHQGRGHGAAAIRHVEQRARANGCECLILAVNKRNEKALRSYRANGFTVRSEVVTDIGGGYVMDDFVMEKRLDG
jgi:diamine N-acetyltransferase